MAKTVEEFVKYIQDHRVYAHPIFERWISVDPTPEVIGAFFHQMQCFCAATRLGRNFPSALKHLGLSQQGDLVQAIMDSEEGHGADLAAMVGFLLNRRAAYEICPDIYAQQAVERTLKNYSNQLLSHLPGYDLESGLTIQAQNAIAVFGGRERTDRASTLSSLGTTLALEVVSNRSLIQGEKCALVDSGLYGASLADPEMHYLSEHWGAIGAEEEHEKYAMAAVSAMLTDETQPFVIRGVHDFLDSLADLLDALDAALLRSGSR
jgi:hypothetical protein